MPYIGKQLHVVKHIKFFERDTNGPLDAAQLRDAHRPRARRLDSRRRASAQRLILFILALERARRRRPHRDRARRRKTGERHEAGTSTRADADDATGDARERSEARVRRRIVAGDDAERRTTRGDVVDGERGRARGRRRGLRGARGGDAEDERR